MPRNGRKKGKGHNVKRENGQKDWDRNSKAMQRPHEMRNNKNSTIKSLPNAEQPEDMDEDYRRAIAESLEMMKTNLTLTENVELTEKAAERSQESDIWDNRARKNHENPSAQEFRNTSDTNNNSSKEKSSVTTRVSDRGSDDAVVEARPTSSQDDALVRQSEAPIGITNESIISSLDTSHYVDKYGRVDGQNERHLAMGPGARKKEQQLIKQQQELFRQIQQPNLSRPNQTPHDFNRADQQYGVRFPRNNQNTSRRPTDNAVPRQYQSDKYHFFRGQSRRRSDYSENSTNDDTRGYAPRDEASRNAEFPELPARGLESSTRANNSAVEKSCSQDRTVAPSGTEKSLETVEISKDKEALRLTGFNSRYNVPANADVLDQSETRAKSIATSSLEQHKNNSAVSEFVTTPRVETVRISEDAASGISSSRKLAVRELSASNEPRDPKLYERLAIHDPSLYRLLMQRDIEDSRDSQSACLSDKSTGEENSYDEPTSHVTQETRDGASCEGEESPDDRAIETRNEVPVADQQYPVESFPNDGDCYPINPIWHYVPSAMEMPGGCYVSGPPLPQPFAYMSAEEMMHGRSFSQACNPQECFYEENNQHPAMPRLHPAMPRLHPYTMAHQCGTATIATPYLHTRPVPGPSLEHQFCQHDYEDCSYTVPFVHAGRCQHDYTRFPNQHMDRGINGPRPSGNYRAPFHTQRRMGNFQRSKFSGRRHGRGKFQREPDL